MNLQDPVQLEIFYRALYALAGGAGGAIRWMTAKSALKHGVAHIFIGAMAGTFLHGLMFFALGGLTSLAGMSEFDGKLLGAHVAGVVALYVYAVLPDWAAAFIRSKASTTSTEPME